MLADIISLYDFVNNELKSASILKAYFLWDGTKKSGSKEINLEISENPHTSKIWFYEIKPYKDFVFVPLPVNPSVNVNFGLGRGELVSDSKYFRYVSSPLSNFTQGGENNVKVDFMVFGYIPEDLMEKFAK